MVPFEGITVPGGMLNCTAPLRLQSEISTAISFGLLSSMNSSSWS